MMEERLRKLAGKIRIEDVMAAVRTTEVTRDSAGYGQVAHLRKAIPHPALGVLWVAGATPVTAPFVPFRLGVNDVPPEFKRHRYLTAGEADRFMDQAWQGIESTLYAFQAFKRLFYLTSEHRDQFLPEVTASLTAFEAGLIAAQPAVERTALKLYEAGEPELAGAYLTYYSNTEAMNGLRLAEALSVSIDARTKVQFGIRQPQTSSYANKVRSMHKNVSSKYLIAGLLVHLIAIGASSRLFAEPVALKASYKVRTERAVMIPMRDGKRLSADVFRPDAEGRFPVIIMYHPYRKDDVGRGGVGEHFYFAERGLASVTVGRPRHGHVGGHQYR